MGKIVWASDFMLQPTREARIARELLPRLQERSDHEIVQYAVSGLDRTLPFPLQDVTVYGNSAQSGPLGASDFPLVDERESADFWVLNISPRTVGSHLGQMGLRYVLYPPIDHEPVAPQWEPGLATATEVVPPSGWGEQVLGEALEAGDRRDDLHHPIPPGVDTNRFTPTDATTAPFGVSDDTFVVGMFAREQGGPVNPVRQLRAFERFLNENDLWNNAMLYVHASLKRQEQNSSDIQAALTHLDLGDNVGVMDQERNRWGLEDRQRPELYDACDVVLNVSSGEPFCLPVLESFATGTPVIASGWSSPVELLSGEPNEMRHDDRGIDEFVEADRGWLVPVWDEEPTAENDAWQRTFNTNHIAAALTHAYRNPNLREDKGEAAREHVEPYSWDRIVDQWIQYFDGLEDRLFETDDAGIEWGKVATEQGGVDALGGERDDE